MDKRLPVCFVQCWSDVKRRNGAAEGIEAHVVRQATAVRMFVKSRSPENLGGSGQLAAAGAVVLEEDEDFSGGVLDLSEELDSLLELVESLAASPGDLLRESVR